MQEVAEDDLKLLIFLFPTSLVLDLQAYTTMLGFM